MRWILHYRLREYLAINLWVLPMLFTIGGYFFAHVAVEVDKRNTVLEMAYDPSYATTLLAAMFSGIVTFIGFVITIVLLVPQFAGTQLSPRILSIWYRRSPIKLALSFFFFSAAYVFTVLGEINSSYQPGLSINVAGILVFLGFLFFLWFVSHFSTGIRPASMAEAVARRGRDVISRLYPRPYTPSVAPPETGSDLPPGEPVFTLRNPGDGRYINGINEAGLVALAERLNGIVVVRFAVGEYARAGATLIEVYAGHAPKAVQVRRLIVLGTERTIEQDPAYAIRILVDVAIKGLSHAINDPTTAVQALDRVSDLLHILVQRDLNNNPLSDASARPRVIIPRWTWDDYLRLGAWEIAQYGQDSVQVMRRLRAMFLSLSRIAPPERLAAIEAEVRLLDRAAAGRFPDASERTIAWEPDFQGLGIRRGNGDS